MPLAAHHTLVPKDEQAVPTMVEGSSGACGWMGQLRDAAAEHTKGRLQSGKGLAGPTVVQRRTL